MQTHFTKRVFAVALAGGLLVPALLTAGCGNKGQASATPTATPVAPTQKINAMEANPNLPPQAKEAARAAIQAQQRGKSAAK